MSIDKPAGSDTTSTSTAAAQPTAERKPVSLADLRKPRPSTTPAAPDKSGFSYEAQIKARQQSEQRNSTEPDPKAQAEEKPASFDKYIYLRLPKDQGMALRIHAWDKGKKVTTIIEGLVAQYLKDNNLIK
jgi:hypothetical protein